MLFGGIIRAIFVFISTTIFKIKDAPYRNSTQFIGEFLSSIIAFNISLFSFKWFEKESNLILLGLLFIASFFSITSKSTVQEKFKPNAQRLGVFMGVLITILTIKYSA